jgi:phage-related protein
MPWVVSIRIWITFERFPWTWPRPWRRIFMIAEEVTSRREERIVSIGWNTVVNSCTLRHIKMERHEEKAVGMKWNFFLLHY